MSIAAQSDAALHILTALALVLCAAALARLLLARLAP